MKAHSAPHKIPQAMTANNIKGAGNEVLRAINPAPKAPMTIWPSPPIFQTRARNATAAASPVKAIGSANTSELSSALQEPTAPSKMARYVSSTGA